MGYQFIDEHPRRGQLDYYSGHPSPFYGVTWQVPMGGVKALADARGYYSHLTLCYYMARAMLEVEDFLYAYREGRLVLYDQLHIGTTVPTPDGQFGFASLEYRSDVGEFMAAAAEAQASVILDGKLRDGGEPNSILFTAMPGVPFTGVTHVAATERTDARPRVAFGRFGTRSGVLEVPVGLQVNHLFISGRSLGELASAVERHYSRPE
jgi:chloramphenicol O-acetyltransferase type A